jgi:putative RecB family exonuclease
MVRPRLPERPAAWTARGTALHKTFEEWELSGRETDPAADYLKFFDEEIDKFKSIQPDPDQWFITPRVKGRDRDILLRRADGLEQTKTYQQRCLDAEWRVFTLPNGDPAIEVPFEIQLGEITVRGAIDYIEEWPDGKLSLKDLKTGSKEKYDDRQLGLYKLAMEQVYGLELQYGRLWYTKLDRGTWVDLTWVSNVDTLVQEFAALDRGISENVFLANPSDNCRFCSVQNYCSVKGSMPIERKY